MRKYYSGITLFKLIGSLLVLVGHVRLPELYLRLGQQLPGLQAAMAFVVPCFYCISGFLAYKGWTGAARPHRYVQRYLLWLGGMYAGFCAVAIANGAAKPWHWPIKSMVLPIFKFLCVVGPYPQLWFVPPLLLSVAVVYCCERTGRLWLALGLAGVGFVLAQLSSGTPRVLFEHLLGPVPVYHMRYTDLFADAIARHCGTGFPFVLAGVLVARHEERFRQLPGRWLAAAALGSLAVELVVRYQIPTSYSPPLVWSMLPVGMWLFYGVLHIQLDGIRRHHAFINRFSMVLYFLHMPLLVGNLLLLEWPQPALTAGQSAWCVLLTALQCWLLTVALHAYLSQRAPHAAPAAAKAKVVAPMVRLLSQRFGLRSSRRSQATSKKLR